MDGWESILEKQKKGEYQILHKGNDRALMKSHLRPTTTSMRKSKKPNITSIFKMPDLIIL